MRHDRTRRSRTLTRRAALAALTLAATRLYVAPSASARANDDLALERSLDALAARQNADGSFGNDRELFGRDPGVAALCGLAFAGSGSFYARGRYGVAIKKIVDYLLSQSLRANARGEFDGLDAASSQAARRYLTENDLSAADVDGLVANFLERGRKPTYGHGYASLFLAETLGSTRRPEHRDRARAAVALLERTQNSEGGWRYDAKRVAAADLSVTTCQLSALRAARNAGLRVDASVFERGLGFVRRLQNSDGGFRYMSTPGASGYGRTAAAIHALQSGGAEEDESTHRAFRYLDGFPDARKIEYWSVAHFYASLAYWRGGASASGRARWERYWAQFKSEALARRGEDYLWRSSISTEAESAFVICALEVPQEGAPLFLR